ncbi:MAG: choice-of-anchor X domain-containing protein, partial [Patescibacteria group bacterium]
MRILSFNNKSKLEKDNILVAFWNSFLSVSRFEKIMLIIFFLIIAVTPYIVTNYQILNLRAQIDQEKAHTIFSDSVEARFKPIAIYNDGISAASLEVKRKTAGGSIKGKFSHLRRLSVDGEPFGPDTKIVTFYDDGTNGDVAANDGIYTLWPITSTADADQFGGRMHWNSYPIAIEGGSESRSLGIVKSGIDFPSKLIGHNAEGLPVMMTDYIVSIQDDAYVDGSSFGLTSDNHGAITNKLYQFFDDSFDFLILFSVLQTDGGTNHHLRVRNSVKGIGNANSLFDLSDINNMPPGSIDKGVLSGTVYINDGGTTPYGSVYHEIIHRWGVMFGGDLGFPFHSHWNGRIDPETFYTSDVEGVLGGSNIVENPDGTITPLQAPPIKVLPPLESYLMGLVPVSEVPDYIFYKYRIPDRKIIEKFILKTDNMVSAFGPRIPDVKDSQKEFKSAFVVVSPPGEPLTPAEFVAFSIASQHLGSLAPEEIVDDKVVTPPSFAAITGFRGKMGTSLQLPPPKLPAITMTAPNGGEVLEAGSALRISWTSKDIIKANISLYKDGSFDRVIVNDIPDRGEYAWNIPSISGSTYKVRVASATDSKIFDESDNPFTINARPVPVNNPPVVVPIGDKEVFVDKLLAVSVEASDSDNDVLYFQANPLPVGALFVPLGDVNLDSKVNVFDSILLNQYLVGTAKFNEFQLAVADITKDGTITIHDVVALQRIVENISAITTYRFLWQPVPNQAGTHEITFFVSDGLLDHSQRISVSVATNINVPPIVRIVSVAGDTAEPYVDNVDDGVSEIVVDPGDPNVVCKWYDSDIGYSKDTGRECIAADNSLQHLISCSIQTSDIGAYTRFISCADTGGNANTLDNNLHASWDVVFGVTPPVPTSTPTPTRTPTPSPTSTPAPTVV